MCGIAGVIRLDGRPLDPETDVQFLRVASARLAYRGPDDKRIVTRGNVGFAFTRLAIVDLRGGAQPFVTQGTGVLHMTNGQVYNHRSIRSDLAGSYTFRTESDCEVIGALYDHYGEDYPRHINGMFATALFDEQRRKVLLVRDRLGIKPLFYHVGPNILVFASEIKALLGHPVVPRDFDWQTALGFALEGQRPRPHKPLETFFRGIRQLPGGHLLCLDLESGELRIAEYWNPHDAAKREALAHLPKEHFVEAYGELLADAVKMRLQGDVECGIFLSGGIDSVSVARLARPSAQLHTFTALSQSSIVNGDAPKASQAARELGLPNHQVQFDLRNLALTPEAWKAIVWACETPLVNVEQLYKYWLHRHAQLIRPNLKVILLGQGSDDFNGGYSISWAAAARCSLDWPGLMAALRRRQRDALLAEARSGQPYEYLLAKTRSYAPGRADTEMDDEIVSSTALERWTGLPPLEHPWRLYPELCRRYIQIYNLWHEDRTAAAHGIEARVPFLDHRLVELTYAIPERLYGELFFDKAILREAMRGRLSEQLLERPKVMFHSGRGGAIINRFFYGVLTAERGRLLDEALDGAIGSGNVLNAAAVRRLVNEIPLDPEYSSVPLLMELVNMGLLSAMSKANEEPPRPAELLGREVEMSDWDHWYENDGARLFGHAAEDASIVK